MAVLALMYHGTPGDQEVPLDVPIKRFREQIDRLADAGASFIPFSQIGNFSLLTKGRHVAVTFDDGHGSNAAAVEHLANRGIPSTLFIVKEWCEAGVGDAGRSGYLHPADLRSMGQYCALGAHGVSHTGFSRLRGDDLNAELSACRDFLGGIIGKAPVELSLPGGDGNIPTILKQCLSHGFTVIGNSVQDLNTSPAESYARVVLTGHHDAAYLAKLVRRPTMAWDALRAARAVKKALGR